MNPVEIEQAITDLAESPYDPAEFSNYLESFRAFQANIQSAARAFYYYVGINQLALARPEICEALNKTPRFWLDYTYYALLSAFVIVGRIFDQNPKSHSISNLLFLAKSSNYFTNENLRKRKISASPHSHDWLDDYIKNAYEFSEEDWKKLEQYAACARKNWEETIKPIRNKIFAHNDVFENENARKDILNKYDQQKFDDILNRCMVIENILEQAGDNGKKPNYAYDPVRTKKHANTELENITNLLTRL